MSTKKETEVVEIEVLTQEQIEALDKELQDDFMFLTENMNANKLAKLNPVLIELEKLQDRMFKLSLVPLDEKGKFNKENIQEYKDLKANTRTFNSTIRAVAKAMKDPLNETKKHIINIEKGLLEEASNILESIDVEFQPYVDAEAEKARIAKEKKDAALNAKVAEAEAEVNAVLEQSKKIAVLNKIKYELITDKIISSTSNHVANSNLSVINEHKAWIDDLTFDKLVDGQDVSLLEEVVLNDLKETFDISIKNAKANIESKINALELEVKNRVHEEVSRGTHSFASVNPEPPVQTNIPAAPVQSETTSVTDKTEEVILNDIAMMNGFEFADYCLKHVKFILELIDKEIANGNDCSPKIYQIKSIINPIKDIE